MDVAILQVPVDLLHSVLQSFPPYSAGGAYGLSPSHLRDLIGYSTGASADHLTKLLLGVVPLLLSGIVPDSVASIVCCARLFAFGKKNGNVQSQSVACYFVSKILVNGLLPAQLGFGVIRGIDAATHAA
ncbi:hypothetical protein GJ496_004311 [Pomphorhynchus laevis]|nr:hypothetical protein GJ496_004311 [Pomphorhynchus laevis]